MLLTPQMELDSAVRQLLREGLTPTEIRALVKEALKDAKANPE